MIVVDILHEQYKICPLLVRMLPLQVKLPQKELPNLQNLQTDLIKVLKRPGVVQQSIEVALSKFTDAGAEVLLQCLLLSV